MTQHRAGSTPALIEAMQSQPTRGGQAVRFDLTALRCKQCAQSDDGTELLRVPAGLSCELVTAGELDPGDLVHSSVKCTTPACRRVWYVRVVLRRGG